MFRRFMQYYKSQKKLFILDMLASVLFSVIGIVYPVVTRTMLNDLIPNRKYHMIVSAGIVVLLLYVVRFGLKYFTIYYGHVMGVNMEAHMRRDLFHHLQELPFSFYDEHETGKIMSRLTTDLFEVAELAHHGPEDFTIAVLTILGSFFFLLKIRWELAVAVFVSLPILLAITIFSRRKFSETSIKVKETTSQINADLESSISGIRVTKGFTNEQYEINKFAESNVAYSDAKKKRFWYMASFHTNIELSISILSLIIIAVGGWLIMQEKMHISDLVAANLFVASFMAPIRKLSAFVEQFATGMAGFYRFLELMRTDTCVKDEPDAVELLSARGNITFENVNFSYNENFPVLEDINLNVKAGEKYALVGSSGGGKTTICSLIPRFYEATAGRILLDGIDLKKIKLSSLRKQIGIVQQDVFLFAGTVKENIAYGKIGATDEEIIEAAKRAEIHEDILKMPDGYDTIVGERGIKLSGGQKQRVSIARCFLKNPPVLILDEATSALDTATEIKIQHSFDELSKGRTTIVIAHRLSTIKNADTIAVVDEKGIVESGSHEELLAKKGEYYNLYTAQKNL